MNTCDTRRLLLGGSTVDGRSNLRNLVSRKAAPLRVFADHLLVRSAIHAVDLDVGHVAVDPLDLRSEHAQHRAAGLRSKFEVLRAERSGARHFPLDYILGHDTSLSFIFWE